MNEQDKTLIKDLYDLTDIEIFQADKLYRRKRVSVCMAAKIVKSRRLFH